MTLLNPAPWLLVVQPDEEAPAERFGAWLDGMGVRSTTVRPGRGQRIPSHVDADGLLVLGGDMGANDDGRLVWLSTVRELLKSSIDAEVPTLGICLGAQLLAQAAGGVVARGDAGSEVGPIEVRPREAVKDDALFGALRWPLTVGSMHRDAIVHLPPNGVWLAESSQYAHQAFRVGSSAWGVQFHPELSPRLYRRWAEYVQEDAATSRRINSSVAELRERDAEIQTGTRDLAMRFGQLVEGHSTGANSIGTPTAPFARSQQQCCSGS